MANWLPVVVIGAPRSGTNLLRNVLTYFGSVATWPCDEINYIWRHGNVGYPSDEFAADLARPDVCRYIRQRFEWVARRYGAEVVVEKTCANSLRVPFVDRVLPEARYVFIRRDGLDAVGSAMARWKAPLDIAYLARKTRFVPASDLPFYAGRYLWNRVYRVFSGERRLAFWGPQINGMAELVKKHPLDEVCALQWQRCVESAWAAFQSMPSDRWTEVVYEDFVRDPEPELERILDFLSLRIPPAARRAAVSGVRSDSIGKGRAALGAERSRRIEELVRDSLVRFGYA